MEIELEIAIQQMMFASMFLVIAFYTIISSLKEIQVIGFVCGQTYPSFHPYRYFYRLKIATGYFTFRIQSADYESFIPKILRIIREQQELERQEGIN